MKKIFIIVVLVALTASPALALSVVGSRHDMISSGFVNPSGGASTEVCIFCHTPHGAQTSVTQAPLWNNTAAASVDATVYNSVTTHYPATQASINLTDARLCLACHDTGVGMPVNLPNVGSLAVVNAMDANALLGTNMSNDHPIGMDLGTTDSDINSIAIIIGATGFNQNVFFGVSNTTMWCSTCHDVHDNLFEPFLRKNNAGSAMCKTCHKK